jgi:hypothetical protein
MITSLSKFIENKIIELQAKWSNININKIVLHKKNSKDLTTNTSNN